MNFADDEGYTVIAADERIEDEVALFVGHGSLDVENVENPGLRIMLERLEGYAAASIARHEAWQDSMEVVMAALRGIDPPVGPPQLIDMRPIGWGAWETVPNTAIAPMIPVEWGQRGAFNDRATQEMGGEVYAGCVFIAAAQLMAYWKKPTVYHGQSINWSETIKYTGESGNRSGAHKTWLGKMENAPTNIRQTIADYMWYLGEDSHARWGYVRDRKGTAGAFITALTAVLLQNGYTTSNMYDEPYNKAVVVNALQSRKPVVMDGTVVGTQNGHNWLIDGYSATIMSNIFMVRILRHLRILK